MRKGLFILFAAIGLMFVSACQPDTAAQVPQSAVSELPVVAAKMEAPDERVVSIETTILAAEFFASQYEAESADELEFCVASTRLWLSLTDGRVDDGSNQGAWSLTNLVNLSWENELKESHELSPGLTKLYSARSRADWPAHLLSYESRQKLVSSESIERCSYPVRSRLKDFKG